MVRDLVVVSVSKTKAARESLVDSGVEENWRIEDRRCERMVVLPEPDSPLQMTNISETPQAYETEHFGAHRNMIAWFSPRPPNRDHARPAKSSASPMALPDFPPSGPLADEVYVLREIRAWEDSFDTGSETWNLFLTFSYLAPY